VLRCVFFVLHAAFLRVGDAPQYTTWVPDNAARDAHVAVNTFQESAAVASDERPQRLSLSPLRIAQPVARHAEQRGATSVAFALAWVLKNAAVSATIAGWGIPASMQEKRDA
jgi:aryl-alcohol dehydrogenase-like predicted oxidoreductase